MCLTKSSTHSRKSPDSRLAIMEDLKGFWVQRVESEPDLAFLPLTVAVAHLVYSCHG